MLHPDFPVVEGRLQLTDMWAVTLPFQMNQRVEDDSLVLWRPGFTIWLSAWESDGKRTADKHFQRVRRDADPARFDETVSEDDAMIRLSYRLKEDGAVPGFYTFAFAPGGHIQAAFYADVEHDLETARQIWLSLERSPAPDAG